MILYFCSYKNYQTIMGDSFELRFDSSGRKSLGAQQKLQKLFVKGINKCKTAFCQTILQMRAWKNMPSPHFFFQKNLYLI